MSNIQELFRGVCVIIDDELTLKNELKETGIHGIIKKIQQKDIPLIKYNKLPNDRVLKNFNSISFMILDWDLSTSKRTLLNNKRVQIGDDPKGRKTKKVTKFINKINKAFFVPIFIFSDANLDVIKEELEKEGLYKIDGSNNIFVESKIALESVDVFDKIEEWLKQAPSFYVLKEWELSMQKAKNEMFRDFYNINHEWPKIHYDTISIDLGKHSYALNELLFEHIKSRSLSVKFDEIYFTSENKIESSKQSKDIREVLQGQIFRKPIEKDKLDWIHTGDVFYIPTTGKYYVNIRPQCDCIPRAGVAINSLDLYLIEGSVIEFSKRKGKITQEYRDDLTRKTIFPINNGKAVQFEFKNFSIKKWKNFKKFKIGTLLHPFSTNLTQQYSAFLQRQGLPRIPEKAFEELIKENETKS